jgi:hypothetical protein
MATVYERVGRKIWHFRAQSHRIVKKDHFRITFYDLSGSISPVLRHQIEQKYDQKKVSKGTVKTPHPHGWVILTRKLVAGFHP